MAHRGPHEFNTDFTWRPPAGPFGLLTAEQVDSYDRYGVCVIPDAFDPAEVKELTDEVDPIEARVSHVLSRRGDADVPPDEYTITSNLVLRSGGLRAACARGVLPRIACDLLGPSVRLYWEQSVYKKPQNSMAFPWHQDNGKTFVAPQQYITCWVALTDATEENGCPMMAPGLHLQGTFRHWQSELGWTCFDGPTDVMPVPLPAGSVAVFSSVTVHMTLPNRTDGTRKAYVVQYAPDGAVALEPGPDGSVTRVPQDDADRQFLVSRD
jgi:ectoine hydroxylase-related dioxygenase (phytanoyl-CoA dioxygenase family)